MQPNAACAGIGQLDSRDVAYLYAVQFDWRINNWPGDRIVRLDTIRYVPSRGTKIPAPCCKPCHAEALSRQRPQRKAALLSTESHMTWNALNYLRPGAGSQIGSCQEQV